MAETQVDRLIKRVHSQVAEHLEEWAFLRVALEANASAYAKAALHRYPREDARIYDQRVKRAADLGLGLLEMALAAYIGHLFAEPAKVAEGLGAAVADFIARPTAGPGDARELARLLAPYVLTQGIVWVAVDKPAAESDRPLSAQEEAEAGLRPYAYVVQPDHVRDGAWGRDGQLLWLLVQEDHRDEADPWTSTGEVACRFRLWTREGWALIEARPDPATGKKSWVVTGEGPNAIGAVPFVAFTADPVQPGAFACPGPLARVAHLDRAALNLASQLDEVHMMATFPQLAVPMGSNPTPEDSARALTMGLHSVIPFYGEDGPPQWVVADMAAAQELRKGIADKARQALAVALMDGDVGTEGQRPVQQASGVAKAFDFKRLNGALATVAAQLERGIWSLACLAACWQGEQPPEAPPLDFPDDFDVRSLAQELTDLMGVAAVQIPSATLTKALQKAAARKALPKADAETLAAIDAEIDAGPDAGFDMPGDEEDPERTE